MKKISILLFIFMFLAVPSFAADLYVKSVKAKVLSKPSMRSKTIKTLSRGSKVSEIKRKGKWVMVEVNGKKGWISKYLVSKRPPMKRVSLLARGKNLEKTARKRASAFTSVAAARGLTDYDRARAGRKGYVVDFSALEQMEKINIDEMEALAFIEEGVSR
ncbi:MAG: SH3 domain-containing protein [Deltaproteobacteria bacterium]|nr:SH3 domain-containing protein [Deltaproteobacteria bacterium]